MKASRQWLAAGTGETVQVLRLAEKTNRGAAGWCTAPADLEDSPEIEVMCGGLNLKTPGYAAVWRQGHLLHFGFQEAPSELNETGRALLENAIHYIARFTEDRPIAVTPAGFTDRAYPRSRYHLRRRLEAGNVPAKKLARHFTESRRGQIEAMSAEDAKAWIRAHWDFLASDASGLLDVDPDAQALGVPLGRTAFFEGALDHLGLLARRVPEGPGVDASREAWSAFLDAHRPYLFFTEPAGYVWLVDPLAKKRGVPTAALRGGRRASH